MSAAAPTTSKRSRFKRWVLWVHLFLASLLGVAVVCVLLPQDLSDVEGYGIEPSAAKARDLEMVLTKSIANGHEVVLGEREINLWLAREIIVEQKGKLSGVVGGGRVWVRLKDEVAEVIMERRVFGQRITWSMFIQISQQELTDENRKKTLLHGGAYIGGISGLHRGGRFGRLVVPQGYLHLVISEYGRLATVCSNEIHLAFEEMEGIRIEEGKLVLNPRQSLLENSIHDRSK